MSDYNLDKLLIETRQSRLRLGINTIDDLACEDENLYNDEMKEKLSQALQLLQEVNDYYEKAKVEAEVQSV